MAWGTHLSYSESISVIDKLMWKLFESCLKKNRNMQVNCYVKMLNTLFQTETDPFSYHVRILDAKARVAAIFRLATFSGDHLPCHPQYKPDDSAGFYYLSKSRLEQELACNQMRIQMKHPCMDKETIMRNSLVALIRKDISPALPGEEAVHPLALQDVVMHAVYQCTHGVE